MHSNKKKNFKDLQKLEIDFKNSIIKNDSLNEIFGGVREYTPPIYDEKPFYDKASNVIKISNDLIFNNEK